MIDKRENIWILLVFIHCIKLFYSLVDIICEPVKCRVIGQIVYYLTGRGICYRLLEPILGNRFTSQ